MERLHLSACSNLSNSQVFATNKTPQKKFQNLTGIQNDIEIYFKASRSKSVPSPPIYPFTSPLVDFNKTEMSSSVTVTRSPFLSASSTAGSVVFVLLVSGDLGQQQPFEGSRFHRPKQATSKKSQVSISFLLVNDIILDHLVVLGSR